MGVGWKLPTLKRHAVYALVENIGEPLPDVIDEFFLRSYRDQQSTEAVTEGVLDLIGLHAEELGPDVVRKLIGKAIKRGLAPVRQAAYRIGAEQFGVNFARPALRDEVANGPGLGSQAAEDERSHAGPEGRTQKAYGGAGPIIGVRSSLLAPPLTSIYNCRGQGGNSQSWPTTKLRSSRFGPFMSVPILICECGLR